MKAHLDWRSGYHLFHPTPRRPDARRMGTERPGIGYHLMGNLMLSVTHTETKELVIGIIMTVISLTLLLTPSTRRRLIEVKV